MVSSGEGGKKGCALLRGAGRGVAAEGGKKECGLVWEAGRRVDW